MISSLTPFSKGLPEIHRLPLSESPLDELPEDIIDLIVYYVEDKSGIGGTRRLLRAIAF